MYKNGDGSIFVGSVPRTDCLGNGPYISQKIEPSPIWQSKGKSLTMVNFHYKKKRKNLD
jgi:hypothetical protein